MMKKPRLEQKLNKKVQSNRKNDKMIELKDSNVASDNDDDNDNDMIDDENSSYDDDEEYDEDEEDEEQDNARNQDTQVFQQQTSKKKISTNLLPTKDEQLALRETENLMRTNLLRLQVEELLTEVRSPIAPASVRKRLDQFYSDFEKLCRDIPSSFEVDESWLQKHHVPIQLAGRHSKPVTLTFQAPQEIIRVGSYGAQLTTAPYFNLDICVTMPDECFDKRDILNHIYFDKRKLYLSVLLVNLTKANLVGKTDIHIGMFKGDCRKPILVITDKQQNVTIRIFLSVDGSCFKLTQLRASKSNVRPSWWIQDLQHKAHVSERNGKRKQLYQDTMISTHEPGDESSLLPTPHYNLAILEDITLTICHRILTQIIKLCPAAAAVIVLFKVWLTQIGQRFSIDGLDSHGATMLVCYLYQTKLIQPHGHALGSFQSVLKFLAETAFTTSIFDFLTTKARSGSSETPLTPMTLLIPLDDMSMNILWRVSACSMTTLKNRANSALKILRSQEDSAFSAVFMQKSQFFLDHNLYFHFPVTSQLLEITKADYSKSIQFSFHYDIGADLLDLTPSQFVLFKVIEVLNKALGDRVLSIDAVTRCTSTSNANTAHGPSFAVNTIVDDDIFASSYVISVGLVMNPEHAFRRVDRGPSADDTEALDIFKQFWGPKSELRRFKDGSIVESLIWSSQGAQLIEELVRYITGQYLPVQCGEGGETVRCVNAQLEMFLPANNLTTAAAAVSREKDGKEDGREDDAGVLTRQAEEALSQLRRVLTSSIKDLPLAIESLSPATPFLRYTSLLPPVANPVVDPTKVSLHGQRVSRLIAPITLVGTFISSGRWPADLTALRVSKSAMIIRIAELLRQHFKLKSVVHETCIDVVMSKYVFRIHFLVQQELNLLQMTKLGNNNSNSLEYEASALHAQLVTGPYHHSLVHGLHSRFLSYSTAVRLVSLWLDGHMFSGQIPLEAIELLVASVYIANAETYGENKPLSSTVGFLKALMMLADFDWQGVPLVVNIKAALNGTSSTFTPAEMSQIHKDFDALRQKAGMSVAAMFIVSSSTKSIDGHYEPCFTQSQPEGVVLRMISKAASLSSKQLLEWISSQTGSPTVPDSILRSSSLRSISNVALSFNKKFCLSFSANSGANVGNQLWTAFKNGPNIANIKLFSNLSAKELSHENLFLLEANSVHPMHHAVVSTLRAHFGHFALFFWDQTTGHDLYMIWRPKMLLPHAFTLLQTRYKAIIHDGSTHDKAKDGNVGGQKRSDGSNGYMVLNVPEVLHDIISASDLMLDITSLK